MGDSDDEGKKTKVFGTSHRQPMHGQPMGATPARNPKADGNSRVSTAQSKQEARSALEEAEKFLHAVAAEVLHQAGTMGPGSVPGCSSEPVCFDRMKQVACKNNADSTRT